MSYFTEKETEYLRGQRLGRLATVGSDGSPHVVPVGFRLDPDGHAIEVGGHGLSASKKWHDLQANPRIAFVVDDLESVNPECRKRSLRSATLRRIGVLSGVIGLRVGSL